MTILDRLTDLERQPRARTYSDEEYNLAGFRRWLGRLGNPQDATPWIHVAGTKGKGSTCALVESILRAHGLRTGLFTSPHLDHYGERFRFDGRAWTLGEFERALERLEPMLDQREPHPSRDKTWLRTVFEVLTALAFREFVGVEAGVLEVGLGGRLDCTNVVAPRVCAITPIGMDHMHVLGNTIEAIALEKAGILKPGVPAVVFTPFDERRAHAHATIVARAHEVGAPLVEPCPVEVLDAFPHGQRVRVHLDSGVDELMLALPGDFQAANLGIAVRTAELFLRQIGRSLDVHALAHAAATVEWPGRLEVHAGTPPLVIDAAHCPLSAAALGRNLATLAPVAAGPFVLLWGMNRDKDREAFARALLEAAGRDTIVRAVCFPLPGTRGATPQDLASTANALGVEAECALSPADGLDIAAAYATAARGSVLATGSLYALTALRARHAERFKG
ncbi:MAG: hypothetical protein KF858_04170 [Candidatus Sumerlaeia bacterium]|nr:hypothetical protein [Candidatus Sumerlaeia bacterium]